MNQQDTNQHQLILPRKDVVGKQAFDGDLLQRDKLAAKLTGYLDRLRAGAVLAIDAPWGEGKTWFGRNWEQYLKDKDHKVVFIDAFEQDYVEDPFLLLAAEIAEVMGNKDATEEFRSKAAGVMKAILPIGTKALINIMGRVALGTSDVAKVVEDGISAASDETADAAGKWVEGKINYHAQEKDSLKSFKDEITKIAAAQDKPVVIIIDELDRCKPTFAVQLIERVKHLFDVPNLVFVLLLNRNQLEKAVKGVYGAETDASAYLGKFVNFFFMLPKRTSVDMTNNNHVKIYVFHVFKRYNFENKGRQGFEDNLSAMATIYGMSLRDIEQAIALYAFAQPFDILNNFLAYAIALKIKDIELFQRLSKDNNAEAHKVALEKIDKLNKELTHTLMAKNYLNPLSEWHVAHINGFKEEDIRGNFKKVMDRLWEYNIRKENIFPSLANQIDLSIEM